MGKPIFAFGEGNRGCVARLAKCKKRESLEVFLQVTGLCAIDYGFQLIFCAEVQFKFHCGNGNRKVIQSAESNVYTVPDHKCGIEIGPTRSDVSFFHATNIIDSLTGLDRHL